MTPAVPTPKFIRWAISRRCPFRLEASAAEPETAERLLRAAREYALAEVEGRISGDVVLESQAKQQDSAMLLGFSVADALSLYGGPQGLQRVCGPCVANSKSQAAGCIGTVIGDWPKGWNDLATNDWRDVVGEEPWHELWRVGRFEGEQLLALANLCEAVAAVAPDQPANQSSGMFLFADERQPLAAQLVCVASACRTAHAASLQLRVTPFPAGRIEGRHWLIPSHCGQCAWSAAEDLSRRTCPVCNVTLLPAKRRLLRGTRPYRPLSEFLTREALEGLAIE